MSNELNLSTHNIVDIGERLAMSLDVRSMLTMLSVGQRITLALKAVMPGLSQPEQKFLCTLVSFRLMGGFLPASVEMITRLPMFASSGIDAGHAIGVADRLCAGEIIEFMQDEKTGEGAFSWPALEKLIHVAITEADAPQLVTTDGKPLI